jgi:sugar fermentation stimulation protein A
MVLRIEEGLQPARILRRYKRFLADVELPDGSVAVAHCANTGAMTSCWAPGDAVLLRVHDDPRRKLQFTLIACRRGRTWVGVDTGVPNALGFELARRGLIPGLPPLAELRREVRYGRENSRVDLCGTLPSGVACYIEVKNATLREGRRVSFPDAVSARGEKHLRELQGVVAAGQEAVILFLVQRGDVSLFDAARAVDPASAAALDRAAAAGVRVVPYQVVLATAAGQGGLRTLRWEAKGPLPWVHSS